jgi:hypothetical protein
MCKIVEVNYLGQSRNFYSPRVALVNISNLFGSKVNIVRIFKSTDAEIESVLLDVAEKI